VFVDAVAVGIETEVAASDRMCVVKREGLLCEAGVCVDAASLDVPLAIEIVLLFSETMI
jgi:hypothetical protein